MRKTLVASLLLAWLVPAHAADNLPKIVAKAPPMPVETNWTGVYLGVQVGAGIGAQPFDVSGIGITNPLFNAAKINALGNAGAIGANAVGFLGGPSLELLYQVPSTPWVFGVGADWNYSSLSAQGTGSGNSNVVPGIVSSVNNSATASLLWDASVYGKIGYAFDNNKLLAYAIGGLGLGDLSDNAVATSNTGVAGFPVTTLAGATSNVHLGWTAGAGLAWKFEPSWVLKVEYRYVNLGNEGVTLVGTSGAGVTANTQAFNTNDKAAYNKGMIGLSYAF